MFIDVVFNIEMLPLYFQITIFHIDSIPLKKNSSQLKIVKIYSTFFRLRYFLLFRMVYIQRGYSIVVYFEYQ